MDSFFDSLVPGTWSSILIFVVSPPSEQKIRQVVVIWTVIKEEDMVFRRHFKVLLLILGLCFVSAILYSVGTESHEETLNNNKDETWTADLTSSEPYSEEEEVEVEPYWDVFKPSDIQPDKDVFFIESSGLVTSQEILKYS